MASESESEKRETRADIVAELRSITFAMKVHDAMMPDVHDLLCDVASRIEAAWKRDAAIHAMTCEANERLREHLEIALEDNERPVGNAAALRSALEKVRFYLPYFLQYMRLHWEDAEAGGYYERILEVVNAALSAPARQCDVGTAEEQFDRFAKHCIGKDCDSCEHGNRGRSHAHCALVWAQTPYDAEKGGKA